jgi:hypothetical protein
MRKGRDSKHEEGEPSSPPSVVLPSVLSAISADALDMQSQAKPYMRYDVVILVYKNVIGPLVHAPVYISIVNILTIPLYMNGLVKFWQNYGM